MVLSLLETAASVQRPGALESGMRVLRTLLGAPPTAAAAASNEKGELVLVHALLPALLGRHECVASASMRVLHVLCAVAVLLLFL